MIKRATWFVGGVAAGAAGAGYAKKKVTQKVKAATGHIGQRLAPATAVTSVAQTARQRAHDVVDAVREGRVAMAEKEHELRKRRDMRVETIDQHLEPGDRILVDGKPVETGRVIVLKPRPARPKRGRRTS